MSWSRTTPLLLTCLLLVTIFKFEKFEDAVKPVFVRAKFDVELASRSSEMSNFAFLSLYACDGEDYTFISSSLSPRSVALVSDYVTLLQPL